MKQLCFLLFLLPCFIFPQKKIKPQFGFAINDGRGQQFKTDKNVAAKGRNALGYYLSMGLKKEVNEDFEVYLGLRWGSENSRFRVTLNQSEQYTDYYFNNKTLTFLFAPGLVLDKKNKIFLTFGLTRVFKSSTNGGGEGSFNGTTYSYQYGDNLVPDCWDFRQGIKWQVKPFVKKKFKFELGLEIPMLYYTAMLHIENNYSSVITSYNLNYHTNFFQFGVVF